MARHDGLVQVACGPDWQLVVAGQACCLCISVLLYIPHTLPCVHCVCLSMSACQTKCCCLLGQGQREAASANLQYCKIVAEPIAFVECSSPDT